MESDYPLKSILVAVPTMGGIMKSKTTQSLFLLSKVLASKGVNADMRNIDASDVVTVRNIYANTVLRSDRWDGLLFVDSDMEFLPRLVLKMLTFKAPAAAVAYPKKKIDLDLFAEAVRDDNDVAKARARSSDFNVLPRWNKADTEPLKRVGSFCSMAAAGMGCSLIARGAFQAMVDAKVVPKRVDLRNSVKEESWGFFDPVKLGHVVLGEDYSFWYRWTKLLGRSLWVCVDEEVSHVGDFSYSGLYSALLPETKG